MYFARQFYLGCFARVPSAGKFGKIPAAVEINSRIKIGIDSF